MDAGHILVAVLTSAAVGWLVWVEVHSRQNATLQSAHESVGAGEPKTNEPPPIIAATPARWKDKAGARISWK